MVDLSFVLTCDLCLASRPLFLVLCFIALSRCCLFIPKQITGLWQPCIKEVCQCLVPFSPAAYFMSLCHLLVSLGHMSSVLRIILGTVIEDPCLQLAESNRVFLSEGRYIVFSKCHCILDRQCSVSITLHAQGSQKAHLAGFIVMLLDGGGLERSPCHLCHVLHSVPRKNECDTVPASELLTAQPQPLTCGVREHSGPISHRVSLW